MTVQFDGTVRFDGLGLGFMGERGNRLAGEGWRYTEHGTARHKIDRATDRAYCGLNREWFGTGSQAEYERLAGRPKCATCVQRGAT